MVYPKTVHIITSFEEWKESHHKLDELWNLLSKIEEIENVYLTVTSAEDNYDYVNSKDYPYIVNYIKDNGLEELTTKEYARVKSPDLIVKTGAPRLTNTLLWQTAYSEYYFTEKPLKSLNVNKLNKILKNFQSHHRTYGM